MIQRSSFLAVAGLWLALAPILSAQQAPSVLDVIPGDAQGFVLVGGLEATAEKITTLSTRFQLPIPKLTDLMAPFEKGLDDQRQVALAWLPEREGDDPQTALTHFVLYVPVVDYAAFVEQLGADNTDGKIAEIAMDTQSLVVAQQGSFAVVAPRDDRASLEHALQAKEKIAKVVAPLAEWLDRNDVSIALSPSGTSLMFSKLKEGLAMVKAGAAGVPGGGAEMVEASLKMYEDMFDAAEKEFTQLAIGFRIDPENNVQIHKRLLTKPQGELANTSEPEPLRRSLAHLPAGPYVMAVEGVTPKLWSKELMAQSFNILKTMQDADSDQLTEEQTEQLSELAAKSMKDVRSMSFAMGVGEPGASMYSKMVGIIRVEDAKSYMETYEASIQEISKLMKDGLLGGYEVESVEIGDTPALHLTMDMTKFVAKAGDDIPGMKEYYATMFGPDGKLSIFLAAADKENVVMAYVSPENLTRTLNAYRAEDGGLGTDEQLKKTEALLSDSAQWVGYLSPGGMIQFGGQMAAAMAPDAGIELPDFQDSPPIGFAAEMTDSHLDIQLVIPLESIDAIVKFATDAQTLVP